MEMMHVVVGEAFRDTYHHKLDYYYRVLLHPFNGLFSRTTCVSRQHIILDFTAARDDGAAVASAGPYANHLHLAADR